MMALLIIMGYAVTIAVIVIAVVEAGRMDKEENSQLPTRKITEDSKKS